MKLLLNKTFLLRSVDNYLIYIVWRLILLPNTYVLKCFCLQVLLFTNLLLSSLVCLMACFKRILRKGKQSNPWQLFTSSFFHLWKNNYYGTVCIVICRSQRTRKSFNTSYKRINFTFSYMKIYTINVLIKYIFVFL